MGYLIAFAAMSIIPIVFGLCRIGRGANKFHKLGDIRGMPIKDIVAVVGYPTSISQAGNGGQLYQWIKTSGSSGYHYAIVSDGKGCAVGYTHQFVS